MESGAQPLLSIVAIGFNEAATIRACLESCRAIEIAGGRVELIYVDGGSSDATVAEAHHVDIDSLLESEGPRRAAENRNTGLRAAAGRYVQFVDGDMQLDPAWPAAAIEVLERDPVIGAVFGRLEEANQSAFYQALQTDWEYPEGSALYVGGAAMWRRETLDALGGFPEDVVYGEEPYLCWRMRNELGLGVWHLRQTMAQHDLAYRGFRDYLRRNVRVGETYAEIAARCWRTQDPFWKAEVRTTLAWGGFIAFLLTMLLVAPAPLQFVAGALLVLLLARKWFQGIRRGVRPVVALLYALHTYGSKLTISYGIAKWRLRRGTRPA